MENRKLPCPACGRTLRRLWLLFPHACVRCPSCQGTFAVRLAGRSFSLDSAFFVLAISTLSLVERNVLPDRQLVPGEVSFSVAMLIWFAVAAVLGAAGCVEIGSAEPPPVSGTLGRRLLGITGAAMLAMAGCVVGLWLIAYDRSPMAAFYGSVLGFIEMACFAVYLLVHVVGRRRRSSASANAA